MDFVNTPRDGKNEWILVHVLVFVLTKYNFCSNFVLVLRGSWSIVLVFCFCSLFSFVSFSHSRSYLFLLVNSTFKILKNLTKTCQINEKIDENRIENYLLKFKKIQKRTKISCSCSYFCSFKCFFYSSKWKIAFIALVLILFFNPSTLLFFFLFSFSVLVL